MTTAPPSPPQAAAATSPSTDTDGVPEAWYSILADLPFELPPDLPPPVARADGSVAAQLPLELVRQAHARKADIPIPEEVRERYASWRPTPLRRARGLERHLGTTARIYYKYEGGNASGSHKLNTSIPQAYYYARAGVRRVTTGTGAGQWGTALAMASQMFGIDCTVYMVEISFRQKPYRRVVMNLFGADVHASASDRTEVGRRYRESSEDARGNLALAMAEAIEDAAVTDMSRFCVGSGESYSILHQTVIGIEAERQLDALGERPDIVVASMGAGSNFGGTAFPFLRRTLTGGDGGSGVRCISVEPASCPKLTRGVYAYDVTDFSGVTALEQMYTLGHGFVTPAIHAGGLRYHATSKLVSALYHHGLIEAVAYPQTEVFRSGTLFAQTEGLVPAPESAHAIHAAVVEAERARDEGRSPAILVCVSGHGHFDMSAYDAYLSGQLVDDVVTEDDLARARATLPVVGDVPS